MKTPWVLPPSQSCPGFSPLNPPLWVLLPSRLRDGPFVPRGSLGRSQIKVPDLKVPNYPLPLDLSLFTGHFDVSVCDVCHFLLKRENESSWNTCHIHGQLTVLEGKNCRKKPKISRDKWIRSSINSLYIEMSKKSRYLFTHTHKHTIIDYVYSYTFVCIEYIIILRVVKGLRWGFLTETNYKGQ